MSALYGSNAVKSVPSLRHLNRFPPPTPKEKAIALYNFVPQDSDTQIALTKGDHVQVLRKDADGWWLVCKNAEKGLVPGNYVQLEEEMNVDVSLVLAAREASNKRFQALKKHEEASRTDKSDATLSVNMSCSELSLESECMDKPKPRKLRKCFACKETILGRTKFAKNHIFHEVCLLCRGCREMVQEDQEFTLITKKVYHAECAENTAHCSVCEEEILGRIYQIGTRKFHKLCIHCSVCKKLSNEVNAVLLDDQIVCKNCQEERMKEQEHALRLAEEEAKREALKLQNALKVAKEQEMNKKISMKETICEAKQEQRKTKDVRFPTPDACRISSGPTILSDARTRASSSISSLGEFDLKARASAFINDDRLSDISNLDAEYDTRPYGNETESSRVSEVFDLEKLNLCESQNGSSRHRDTAIDRLSSVSGISDFSDIMENDRNFRTSSRENMSRATQVVQEEEFVEPPHELCADCSEILEGGAVSALDKLFHAKCFKCAECLNVISESEGYAEKEGMAFHQNCYHSRYGRKCFRCQQPLKGKVIKAMENLYHPDCFECYQCQSALSESFFEHAGHAVCANCKQEALRREAPIVQEESVYGTAAYEFIADDESQLTIRPGDCLQILRKDPDGWWFAEMDKKRGYVPGSYLVEHPPKSIHTQPEILPGFCSACRTQNPIVARFCRSCGKCLKL